MSDDLAARERRLQPRASSSEHQWTVLIRFVCERDSRHHIGDLEAVSGSGWQLTLQPAEIGRFLPPVPGPSRAPDVDQTSIFDHFDFPEDDGRPEPQPVLDEPDRLVRWTPASGRSVLRWEDPPPGKGDRKIRWTCCHCDQNWQRIAKQDNVLKWGRVAHLVTLMREHGPSRLRVELSATGLQAATNAVLRHAEQSSGAEG